MKNKAFEINNADNFYRELLDRAPQWFADFREQSLKKSREIHIPTLKDEEWKYTNLALLADHQYGLPNGHNLVDKEALWQYANKDDIHFVMVNGCFISELSTTDGIDGLTMMHMQEAVNQGLVTQAQMQASTPNDIEPFLSINGAYHRCGAYIKVDKKFKSDRLIHIIHVNVGDNEYAISPRSMVVVERSAQAKVLESHISFYDNQYFVNPLTDIYCQENAILHYVKAQKESNNAIHIGQTRVWQQQDSQFKSFSFMNGSQLTRNNLTITLQGEGSYSLLNGLYLIDGKRHVDNHTLVDHQQPHCESSQLYKGILYDQARAVFNGKIYVKPIAQQTNAYQLNKNLLLGQKARVDTKPQLEIFADDVKCTHGAAIGQMDANELFYLQTRGVSRSDAETMLSEGFINDVLDSIEIDAIRTKINKLR